MSNWRAILAHDSVCTSVFIECHCCGKKLSIATGSVDCRSFTDDMAVKAAHVKNWTVGSVDGQTLCPKCKKLDDDKAFAIYVERLKAYYPHHELCKIWGEVREKFHERRKAKAKTYLRPRPRRGRRVSG